MTSGSRRLRSLQRFTACLAGTQRAILGFSPNHQRNFDLATGDTLAGPAYQGLL